MEAIFTLLVFVSAFLWLIVLILPWRPWSTRELVEAEVCSSRANLEDITVVIPARDESEHIRTTLHGLAAQGDNLKIILIDDQSGDDTVKRALEADCGNIEIISGEPLPAGWSGKLWALEQGLHHVRTPLTLLLDADIELEPGMLGKLHKMMAENNIQLVSLMAQLRMRSFWERLLMPAFIYFFKFLYPFALSNSPASGVAAAAGGCILLETRLLNDLGGFQSLKGELIDDCALARKVKSLGCATWIGLTHSVKSRRVYDCLDEIWSMVARTAFTQLGYSLPMLLLCSAALLTLFAVPPTALVCGSLVVKAAAAAAMTGMMLSYAPTLGFYGLHRLWAAVLPLSALLYLFMTWSSAVSFWKGKRSRWKGRVYEK